MYLDGFKQVYDRQQNDPSERSTEDLKAHLKAVATVAKDVFRRASEKFQSDPDKSKEVFSAEMKGHGLGQYADLLWAKLYQPTQAPQRTPPKEPAPSPWAATQQPRPAEPAPAPEVPAPTPATPASPGLPPEVASISAEDFRKNMADIVTVSRGAIRRALAKFQFDPVKAKATFAADPIIKDWGLGLYVDLLWTKLNPMPPPAPQPKQPSMATTPKSEKEAPSLGATQRSGPFLDAAEQPKPKPRRILVIWATILMLVGLGLYPPWITVWGSVGQMRRTAGYHLLFNPPSEEALQMDVARLLLEWVLVLALASGFLWAAPPKGSVRRLCPWIKTYRVLIIFAVLMVFMFHARTMGFLDSSEPPPTWAWHKILAWWTSSPATPPQAAPVFDLFRKPAKRRDATGKPAAIGEAPGSLEALRNSSTSPPEPPKPTSKKPGLNGEPFRSPAGPAHMVELIQPDGTVRYVAR